MDAASGCGMTATDCLARSRLRLYIKGRTYWSSHVVSLKMDMAWHIDEICKTPAEFCISRSFDAL